MLSAKELIEPAAPNRAVGTMPLVDVNLITYNHEQFVAKAIESVLAQKTNFEFRLLIGDDCSTDSTQSIIRDYARQYPECIQALLASEHRGITHKNRVGLEVLGLSAAKYVALLDGDDYWTDPYKLQKQVDFLESHPDFAICCHNVTVFHEDRSKDPANMLPPDYRQVSTLADLFFANFVPTCSTVFRRGLFTEFPDWFYSLRLGDWPIHIMNAQHGKIRYIDEVMAAYRVHRQGSWTSTSPVNQRLELITMLNHVDAYLGFRYKRQVKAAKAQWYRDVARICYEESDCARALNYLTKYFWYSGFQERRSLFSLLLRLRAPILYRSLKRLRDSARSVTTT